MIVLYLIRAFILRSVTQRLGNSTSSRVAVVWLARKHTD